MGGGGGGECVCRVIIKWSLCLEIPGVVMENPGEIFSVSFTALGKRILCSMFQT